MSLARLPEQMWQDVRFAVRNAWKRPGVTAAVLASLALGIGANLALFSVAYPVLMRPLPVAHPEELVELLQKYPGEPRGNGFWTQRSFDYYRRENKVFSELAGTSLNFAARVETAPGDTATVVSEGVTGNYFSMLGLRPELGRLIGAEDDSAPVAVLSWNCWMSRYGGNAAAVGRQITVSGSTAAIVGVAARAYTGLLSDSQTCVWTPVAPKAGLALIGRLRPGVTLDQARAEMRGLYRFTIEERAQGSSDPLVRKLEIELESARGGANRLRDRVGRPMWMLLALVGVLLLLACVNVGGLLLAQAGGREREIAVRSGLGASRARLMRQALTESCLLSVCGAAIGVAAAYLGTTAVSAILDSGRPHERVRLAVEVDGTVVLFAAAVAIGSGLLFGLAPALHAFRAPSIGLRQSGAAQTLWQRRSGQTLAAAQLAIALVLSSLGALFSGNLAALVRKDLGFRPDGVALIAVETERGLTAERVTAALRQASERIERIPGVTGVALAAPTPLLGAGASAWLTAEGVDANPEDKRRISINWSSGRYFETMRIPLLAGRSFEPADETTGEAAILSESAVRRYFGGRDPIGRKITLDQMTLSNRSFTYRVVGVVGDANYREIREQDRCALYLPAFSPGRAGARTFVIRSGANLETLSAAIREVAPGLRVSRSSTLNAQITASIVPERLVAVLSGFFAAVGVLLAAIGLYGLLSHSVTRRTSELGVRMALGATAMDNLRLILGEAGTVAVAGLLVGAPAALWSLAAAARFIPDIEFPGTLGLLAGGALLAAAAAAASMAPARRASRLDPMQCLREE